MLTNLLSYYERSYYAHLLREAGSARSSWMEEPWIRLHRAVLPWVDLQIEALTDYSLRLSFGSCDRL